MWKKKVLLIIVVCLTAFRVDVFGDANDDYINKYYQIAIEQQEQYGIPASITLAQGILESKAGRSTLATEGNNHFGIKCHADWQGEWMLRDDDKPDECFRVYDSPEESFHDHSIFLKKKRYSPLFELEITDYEGWAKGLKRCGYATDPNYGSRLITIIERYGLYNFDNYSSFMDENVEFIQEMLSSTHRLRKNYGLYYVVALPGDTYKAVAKEFKMKEKDLRKYNDAEDGGVIEDWEEIYLEPKHSEVYEDIDRATIGEDETMRTIAQRYGITLKALKAMNKDAKDRPGTVLRLN